MRWMALVAVAACLALTADARFADTQGFSGKHAVDCGACHTLMPGDPWDPASVHLDGLPPAWTHNQTYRLTIRVEGGPPAVEASWQPQGAFDLETDGGRFTVPGPMEGLLRTPSELEITYTGPGTMMRQWTVDWTAPGLTRPPQTVTFWIAGMAANGNHVMNGPDTAGERGDRTAAAVHKLTPHTATVDAWSRRAIPAPTLDPLPTTLDPNAAPVLVTGRVAPWVDHAQWRIDQGSWTQASGRPAFLFYMPALEPGTHLLQVAATLDGRTSEPANATITVSGTDGQAMAADDAPAHRPWLLLLLAAPLAPFIVKLIRDRS